MKDDLQQKLTELLEKMISGMDKGVDFMSAELPDYINQLLMWHAIKSVIVFLFGIVLAYINYIMIKRHLKILNGENWAEYPHTILTHAAVFILSAVFIPIMMFENTDWLQILIAPKVWLVEYISNLV